MRYRTELTVQYYETDMMGIVHHSNYIRYFEVARTEFIKSLGYPYEKIEELGLFVPVLDVRVSYKAPAAFAEELAVTCSITRLGHAFFEMEYEVTSADGKTLHATGWSKHGFTDRSFKLVSLKKYAPEIYRALEGTCDEFHE